MRCFLSPLLHPLLRRWVFFASTSFLILLQHSFFPLHQIFSPTSCIFFFFTHFTPFTVTSTGNYSLFFLSLFIFLSPIALFPLSLQILLSLLTSFFLHSSILLPFLYPPTPSSSSIRLIFLIFPSLTSHFLLTSHSLSFALLPFSVFLYAIHSFFCPR